MSVRTLLYSLPELGRSWCLEPYGPGLLLAGSLAVAGALLSHLSGIPVLLIVLGIGLVVATPEETDTRAAGLNLAAGPVLKIGVVLLGVQITVAQVVALGWPVLMLVLCVVCLTLLVGWLVGRSIGLTTEHAVIAAGAVAICGASAALAIASVLPKKSGHDQAIIITVISVTALSTIAMALYPAIAHTLNLSEFGAGVFFGAAIHDVAQVVGAGALVSDGAVETAAIVKLMRVACLVPVVVLFSFAFRSSSGTSASDSTFAAFPVFLIAFAALVLINSLNLIPAPVAEFAGHASRWCLIVAVAALSVKTSLRQIFMSGGRSACTSMITTLLLALGVLGALAAFPDALSFRAQS